MSYQRKLCVIISLLLWSLDSSFSSEGTFRKPSTGGDERISSIQSDIRKVQLEITELNSAIVSNRNADDLKPRLSTLEKLFHDLKQELDDENAKSANQSNQHNEAITKLTNHFNNLENQMKSLQKLMEDKIKEESNNRLPSEIADAIRSLRFADATALITKMNDDSKIGQVVYDVYGDSQGNTQLLLDFAKALPTVNLSSYVLCALQHRMKSNNHRDPFLLIALAETLESEVVNQRGGSEDRKKHGKIALDETIAALTDTATETLKTAMYNDNYQKNVRVERLANALDDFRTEVSDDVMRRVVQGSYPVVSATKVADNIYSNKYIPQIVAGMVALLEKMISANDLNNSGVLDIGNYLMRLRNMRRYSVIGDQKKEAVNKVIEKLPPCAKNLFFAKKMCIWNRGKSEYLYVASDQYKHDSWRRNVFTWGSGEPVLQGFFTTYKENEYFYFKNTAHDNNFVYAAELDPYSKEKRYVFTWIDGGAVQDKSLWEVKLSGDYCYLRNKKLNEYLYASDNFHSDKRRYVFTWIPNTSTLLPAFQWQIRDCD